MFFMADHHHHHHEPTGTGLEDAARATLEGRGEQWTPMRAVIFQALSRHDRPASAYDIADEVSKLRGKRVALNFWFTTCGPCRGEIADLNALMPQVVPIYEANKGKYQAAETP